MGVKLICYGVREVEVDFFKSLNRYGYELTLVEELLTSENIHLVEGHDSVMLRGNCPGNHENLSFMKKCGIKYLLTRTVGFNHIDLDSAREFGIKVARVPAYSPNAIGELALTLGMSLFRNVSYTLNKTVKGDFTIDTSMFSKEIRNSTVGIIGTGKIGLVTASLYKGLGGKVIGYDPYPSDKGKGVLEYMELDELISTSDLISIHCPYIKEKNHHLVDEEFIDKMKDGAILINTARGPLQDIKAVIRGIESGKIGGFGSDVLEGEERFFLKNFKGRGVEDKDLKRLLELYPRVLITPHIGSYTDEALKNTIEISYENLNEFLTSDTSTNIL